MPITNIHNLPEPFISYQRNDTYSGGHAFRSVTELIDSPQISVLKREFPISVTVDIMDMVPQMIGSAVHHIIEHSRDNPDYLKEERIDMEVDNVLISGQIDMQEKMPDQSIWLHDFKVTSAWSAVYNPSGKKEWHDQMSIYATLVESKKNIPVSGATIWLIMRDWTKREARASNQYPNHMVKGINIPLGPRGQRMDYLVSRINAHKKAELNYMLGLDLPGCTNEERWAKKSKYAVFRPTNKKATRVFNSRKEAENYTNSKAIGGSHQWRIEDRPGAFTRCDEWCSVSSVCPQLIYEKTMKELHGKGDKK